MFKLNLKIALRNLLKNKTYTIFNLLGLSIGLAGFFIILLYINHETQYDKWDPALKRTYMVAADYTKNEAQFKGSKIMALFAKTVKEHFPEVEQMSIGSLEGGKAKIRYEQGKKEISEKLASAYMDSNFMVVYPLKTIAGNFNEIYTDKNNIAISKSAAYRFFGHADPLNKVLIQNQGVNFPDRNLVVKAVWDDKKQPSYFRFDMLGAPDFAMYGDEFLYRTFSTMLRIRTGVDEKQLFAKIEDAYITELARFYSKNNNARFKPNKTEALKILANTEGITSFRLITEPVPNLNLGTFYESSAKQTTIYVLFSLAAFLILVSCINYTNLTLVLAQNRAKEVGIRKVMGAFKWSLVRQFFTETALQCILAFILALIFAELLLPQINQLINAELLLFSSSNLFSVLLQASCIFVLILLLAGIYPAFVLAGFLPSRVLKGNFSTSQRIGHFRRVLMVFQFTTAIALVISFLVIYAQLQFMKQKDMGLNPKQLMSLSIAKYGNRNLNPERFQTIKKRLLAINGVEDVTRATEQPVNDSGWSNDIRFGNTTLNVESRFVDPNYFEVIRGKIWKGRDFSMQLLATDTLQSLILNETAFRKLGLSSVDQPVKIDEGDEQQNYNVIGVVKDIQAYGFEQEIIPTIYFAGDYQGHWRRNIIIRLNSPDISKTITDITELWREIEPGSDPYYTFADEVFAKMNKGYETSRQIIFSFGMLTLIISIFGLISFAAYSAKMRVKEIAVRRILGASLSSLLQLLNKDFVRLVIIANILADLLAYIYMEKWFAHFAYHIEMPYILFLIANACIVVLTIFTVSVQSIRAVKTNPVDVLKYE